MNIYIFFLIGEVSVVYCGEVNLTLLGILCKLLLEIGAMFQVMLMTYAFLEVQYEIEGICGFIVLF